MGIFRIDDLLLPSAFAHPADRLVMHETHLSWVILAGDFAYKVKKAVRFDFIDATSLARREQLCRDELRLNQRLAPQLYLEVVPITWRDGACRIGGAGEALEYAVRMRRFDTDAELATLLDRGEALASPPR
jgi:aminoglycoside phosphotransferase family enzyme